MQTSTVGAYANADELKGVLTHLSDKNKDVAKGGTPSELADLEFNSVADSFYAAAQAPGARRESMPFQAMSL
jgi:hypothetical protein